ncbi:hypothetical protein ACIGXM_11755 [Kitasatospora sp. NPDC052896]|uniref:hypothetical protein n=1 Tax=Kitasatospora sp. NPDC052896 TaxID=3364061 RepID=UPI0037C8118B
MSEDSEATDLPEDLLDLERARVAARRALDVFVCTVAVERRMLFPAHDQVAERVKWPEEQNTRWHELRDAYQQATAAVRAHPLLVEAAANDGLWVMEMQLRTTVPQVEVVVRRDEAGHEVVRVLLGGVEQEEAES